MRPYAVRAAGGAEADPAAVAVNARPRAVATRSFLTEYLPVRVKSRAPPDGRGSCGVVSVPVCQPMRQCRPPGHVPGAEVRKRRDLSQVGAVGVDLEEGREAVLLDSQRDPLPVGRVRVAEGACSAGRVMGDRLQVGSVTFDGRTRVRSDSS